MRDLAIFLLVFGSLPIILARPWVGVIMWMWVSLMKPHKLAWGYMYDVPIALIIGVTTLIAWVLTKDDKKLQVDSITILMIMLVAWTSVTTLFALEPDYATYKWGLFFKIILMTLVALSLVKTPTQFKWYIWVVVLSIGFFSTKGGIFTVQTGGQYRVWGPPGTDIADNNQLALATLMLIPLMIYLAQTNANKWIKYGMYLAAAFSLVSIIGSYSRGGFVGMGAVCVVLWWRSKNKIAIGTVAVLAVIIGLSFVPQKWLDRMDTIQNFEQDASATGRLELWGHAIRIANDNPLVGGGFGAFDHLPTYARLSPEIVTKRNVHSIYFEMLGTQGYVGLIIFLALGIAGLNGAGKIRRLSEGVPGLENEFKFANMMQISLVAYAVSGAFLNLSTYDLYYALLAMIVIQRKMLEAKIANGEVSARNAAPAAARASESWPLTAQPQIPGMPGRSFLRQPAARG